MGSVTKAKTVSHCRFSDILNECDVSQNIKLAGREIEKLTNDAANC